MRVPKKPTLNKNLKIVTSKKYLRGLTNFAHQLIGTREKSRTVNSDLLYHFGKYKFIFRRIENIFKCVFNDNH